MGPYRFRERDDEAKEVLRGIGVDELANVVRGVDFFGGGLEGVRKGNGEHLLGLRDWSEDYGLGICVWWRIYSRRTDRAVGWRRGNF
jgi:hypothetical protein